MPSLTLPIEGPILQTLSPKSIERVLAADTQIYPSSISLGTLTSWINRCPNFALQYVHPRCTHESVGVCIILPLQKPFWEDLINGRIHEWDITPEMLWRPHELQRPEIEVGLHVWHIERFTRWERGWNGFGKYVWRDILDLVDKEKEKRLLRIVGYSALAVTEDGMRLFREQFGWKESVSYDGQWVVTCGGGKNKQVKTVEKKAWMEKERDREGWKIIGDCRMLVKTGKFLNYR